MANSPSSKKRVRQNEKRRLQNRRRKAEVKDVVREVETKLDAGDAQGAKSALSAAYKKIDQVADKGTMHKKTASRRKSRLAKRVAKLAAGV